MTQISGYIPFRKSTIGRSATQLKIRVTFKALRTDMEKTPSSLPPGDNSHTTENGQTKGRVVSCTLYQSNYLHLSLHLVVIGISCMTHDVLCFAFVSDPSPTRFAEPESHEGIGFRRDRVHGLVFPSCGGCLLLCGVISAVFFRAVDTLRYSLAQPTSIALIR